MLQVRLMVADSFESANLSDNEKTVSTNVHHFVDEQLSVENARSIVQRLSARSFGDGVQIIVVCFSRATVEAQNALLKCFEEPLDNNLLILVVPHESVLIPTLRSRFTHIERVEDSVDVSLAKEFINMSYGERLDTIATKVKQKDKIWTNSLVMSLGYYLSEINLDDENKHELYKAVDMAARHIKSPGSSSKMLLENIALSLPRT